MKKNLDTKKTWKLSEMVLKLLKLKKKKKRI